MYVCLLLSVILCSCLHHAYFLCAHAVANPYAHIFCNAHMQNVHVQILQAAHVLRICNTHLAHVQAAYMVFAHMLHH